MLRLRGWSHSGKMVSVVIRLILLLCDFVAHVLVIFVASDPANAHVDNIKNTPPNVRTSLLDVHVRRPIFSEQVKHQTED